MKKAVRNPLCSSGDPHWGVLIHRLRNMEIQYQLIRAPPDWLDMINDQPQIGQVRLAMDLFTSTAVLPKTVKSPTAGQHVALPEQCTVA